MNLWEMEGSAFKRVLAPLTKVRILVPQPNKNKGLRNSFVALFAYKGKRKNISFYSSQKCLQFRQRL